MRKVVLRNFRIIDEKNDFFGSLLIENGTIKEIGTSVPDLSNANVIIDGRAFGSSAALMPAFIDLHAHFRDTGSSQKEMPPPSESLESASMAAVAGGYTTVVCMANTMPPIDTIDKARELKARCDSLGFVNLYPVLSLTKNMEGRELSGIKDVSSADGVLMLSEDGKDVTDDGLFLAAMGEAKRLGIPVSCHCDFGGENNAVRRAIELGKKAGCRLHIAHVSTKEAAELIRVVKKELPVDTGCVLSCEATPHHIGATEKDAQRMGDESFGRVNPPLRSEEDRRAIIAALQDGTIDAIATDHAPHRGTDKAAGAPGFSGLETAFMACLSNLTGKVAANNELRLLSALMSAHPARILRFTDRGSIAAGMRADIVIVDTEAAGKVDAAQFKSWGKCSPFDGKDLRGKVLMTLNAGRIVFEGDSIV